MLDQKGSCWKEEVHLEVVEAHLEFRRHQVVGFTLESKRLAAGGSSASHDGSPA